MKVDKIEIIGRSFIPSLATDFTSPNIANQNLIWELQTDIDLGNAVIDLSTYNITFKSGGGKLTNFTSIDLGNFSVLNGQDSVLFDQSGTIAGEVNGIVYIKWFGLNNNASLISGSTLNGALSDHIAIQNAKNVLKQEGAILEFPPFYFMMQGDGTNPDYTYVNNPYSGAGNVVPDISQDVDIGTMQGFFFEDYVDLRIIGNGSKIIANPNQTCIVNNKGFHFLNSNNIYIENLSYDGNIVQRDPFLIDYNPFHVQHGFGFDGCFNPMLKNITSDNTIMDGFYFGADSGGQGAGYGGTMNNCRANYNYRQGMSVVSHSSLKVYDSHFSFTGKNISLVNGRWLTTSPSAGVDMEAGGTGTAPNLRGQFDMLFQACTFESNHGSGLAVHWGSTRTNVIACTFINNSLFEPQDSVEETTGNNTYENNTFLNSVARLEAGGVHFTGNIFLFDDYPTTNGLNPPSVESNASQAITALDSGNYYADGFHRQSIIKDNLIKIEAENSNFATTDLTVGRVTVNIENAKFDGNRIINALGITSSGGVATMVDIGNVRRVESVDNNEWIFTAAALAKYTGNIGRFTIERENGSFDNNKVDDGYASLSGLPLGGSFAPVELRGSYAKFSSAGGPIDGDEAWEIHVPNINGDLKITTVNSTSQGSGITETWLSTYDVTKRRSGFVNGAVKSSWYFSDAQADTNPNSGNASYMIAARHDSAGNTNLETQIIVEWFGQNGDVNKAIDFYVHRNGSSIPAGTYRKVYDGGLRDTTANIPTTGGADNYTEINDGARYYDTTVKVEKIWNSATSLWDISGGSGATQLSDLSDVGITTPTNKNALMADGIDWESRPLVVNDISDMPLLTPSFVNGVTAIPLGNTFGTYVNQVTTDAIKRSSSYTLAGTVNGGVAQVLINTTTLTAFPTITGSTNIAGSDFEIDTDYYLEVNNNGNVTEHYFIRKDAGGGSVSANSYMVRTQSRVYGLTGNNWVGFGTYGNNNANVSTSKGAGTTPLYSDSDVGILQLPTGATLQRIEIIISSVSNQLTGCDFSMSAIGNDITTLPTSLAENVIVAPTALGSTVLAGDVIWTTIDLADYSLTSPQTLTYAFKPQGTLTATRYYSVATQLYYTIP